MITGSCSELGETCGIGGDPGKRQDFDKGQNGGPR